MATGFPIPSGSVTRGTNQVTLNWSIDWNGTTNPKTVSVTLEPTAGGGVVYTSSALSGTNVVVTGLTGGIEYKMTVFAEGFSTLYGEATQSTKYYYGFTSAVTAWNGSTFVPVTATKVWNGTAFVKATAVKSNSVDSSTPTWGTVG